MPNRHQEVMPDAISAAPPVFDPRYNNLVLNLTYLRQGNLPGSRDLTLQVTNGEGQTWLDPGVTPTLGSITEGTLVIASESFPRFAPLTLTITGADLCFHVRNKQVLSFGLIAQREMMMRLLCTGLWTAVYRYRLTRTFSNDRVILTRINGADNNRETSLEINVLKGSIAGLPGSGRIDPGPRTVISDKLELRRDPDGELKLQFHGARMEWDFTAGYMSGLRVYDSHGVIANLGVLGLAGAGVSISAAFMDTLS